MMDLIELAKQCPEVNITVRAGDLIAANEELVRRAKADMELLVAEARAEEHISRIEAAKILNVTCMTLNRWEKSGYLKPVRIGRWVTYKRSDIDKLLARQ